MKEITIGTFVTDGERNYKITERIGSGGFAVVYKAECENAAYAVKVLTDENEEYSFKNEYEIACEVNSSYSIQYYYINEIGHNDFPCFIIMEFADGGTLADDYQKREKTKAFYSADELFDIYTQLIEGMIDISKVAIHRDIKLNNLLISGGRIKISDYGISKHAGEATRADSKTMKGYNTWPYYAPELWANPSEHGLNTTKVDIYAMGIVFYMLANLYYPYENTSDPKAMHMYSSVKPYKTEVDPVFVSMINKMLEKPIDDRYSTWEEIRDYLRNSSLGKKSSRDIFVDNMLKSHLAKKSSIDKQKNDEAKTKASKAEVFLRLQNQIITKIYNPLKQIVDAFNTDANNGTISLSKIDSNVENEHFSFRYEASALSADEENRYIDFEFRVLHSERNINGSVYKPVTTLFPMDIAYSGSGGLDYRAVEYKFEGKKILLWGIVKADCGIGFNVAILENPNDPLYGVLKMMYLVPLREGYSFHFDISDDRLKRYCVSGFREMRYDIKAETFNFDEIKAMIKQNEVFGVDSISDPFKNEGKMFWGL